MESNITNEKTVVVPKGPITLLMTKNGPIMIVTNNSKLPSQKVLNETRQTLGLESAKAQGGANQHIHETGLNKGKTNVNPVQQKEFVNILTASATERSKSARAKLLIDGLQPKEITDNLKTNYVAKDTGIQWIKKTTESKIKNTDNSKSNYEGKDTGIQWVKKTAESTNLPSTSNILSAAESERSKSIRAKRLIESLQEDDYTENENAKNFKRDTSINWFNKSSLQVKRPKLTRKQSENITKDEIYLNASSGQVELENEDHLYSCHKCGEKFKKIDLMMKHFATHRNEKASTPPAKKLKVTTKEIQKDVDHKQISELQQSGDTTFSCPTCEKKFTQKHSLLSHLLSHVGEKPYSCPFCNKSFQSETRMNTHKMRHYEGEWDCRICAKTFASAQAKKKHMMSIHGEDEDEYVEEKYICGVCDMSFLTKSDLLQHLSEHTENDEPIELFEESFLCPYCEDVFHSKNDLIKHFEVVHT